MVQPGVNHKPIFCRQWSGSWTNLQRNIATATGYELLKAQQKIAVKNFNPNAKSQNRAFRTAKRMLSEFGLGEYVNNGRTLDDLSLLDAVDGDQKVRLVLHRFSNETIFQPTVSDNPLWAQAPWERGLSVKVLPSDVPTPNWQDLR